MEGMLDLLAGRLAMDPAEVSRRSLVRPEEMPYDVGLLYRDGNPLTYDTGDFPGALDRALRAVDYDAFRGSQEALRAQGVYRGIGIAAYVEGTGGPYEGAMVRADPTGRVLVATGACSQGQGHETTFAQIAADVLGVDLGDVMVVGGDTGQVGGSNRTPRGAGQRRRGCTRPLRRADHRRTGDPAADRRAHFGRAGHQVLRTCAAPRRREKCPAA